jgi:ribose-phosphate pyrophosphokinase
MRRARTRNTKGNPVAPIGLIAPPGGVQLAQLVDSHLAKRRRTLKRYQENKLYPHFSRNNYIIPCSCPRFANGEGKAVLHESVRLYDVYILTDIGNYSCQFTMHGKPCPMSPDDHFQDIKRVVGAIGGRARRINVIMPMLYQSRQHKRTGRESLDCAVALKELEFLGVHNIITFDAHNSHVQNAIPLSGFENLHASYQIVKALLKTEKALRVHKSKLLVVSPDEGAVDRCLYYANSLGVELGMFYKRRDTTRVVNGKNPIVKHEFMGADVAGKDVLIVDDLLASGQSILKVATELKHRRARNVYVAVTFALLDDNGIAKYDKAYKEGIISRLYSTNLSYINTSLAQRKWFVTVDVAEFVAYFIDCLNRNESVSALLDTSRKIARFLKRR